MANEKRLIDANALISNYEVHRNLYIDAWGSFSQMPTIDKVSVDTIDTCISDVMNAPTVDAVEVVRCKDCKHWHEGTGWCDKHSHFVDRLGDFCYPEESRDWKDFDADYFCKDGERKDNVQ